MTHGFVVVGVGLVGAGGVGVGEFERGFEDLDFVVVLGVHTGLAALVVSDAEVLDSREGAGGAALLLQVLLNVIEGERESHSQQCQNHQYLVHFLM